jgi:multidrug efflux pump subunit AcrA (membrane-fusion protein)
MASATEESTAEQAVTDARLDLTLWKRELTANRQAGLQASADQLTWVWTSSVEGSLEKVELTEGMHVMPDQVPVTIVDIRGVEILVHVPERYLADLGGGAELLWRPVGFPDSREAVRLPLRRMAPTLDPHTRSRAYYFAQEPLRAEPVWMLPGRTGCGTLAMPAADDWLVVPESAVIFMEGRQAVFLRTEQPSRPEWRHVEVVGRTEGGLLIRGDGFAVGDEVVIQGAVLIKRILLFEEEA